jgi:hypothetical protein
MGGESYSVQRIGYFLDGSDSIPGKGGSLFFVPISYLGASVREISCRDADPRLLKKSDLLSAEFLYGVELNEAWG